MTNSKSTVVQQVAQLLDARIGLKTDMSFRPRLTRALREVVDAHEIDEDRVVAALTSDVSLLDDLLDRVTVQETAFFRHPDQFDAIARDVLPTIDGPLHAWSAACANGQEAYSVAMLFTESGRRGSVLASDVSAAALQRTGDACYAPREMSGVSPARRQRHFAASGKHWQASEPLRAMVSTQRHNLLDPIPRQVGLCQIVMCRNVLIYFSEAHSRLFLDRLADAMNPAAILFVGGAETLWQSTDRFEAVQIGNCYAYRPRPKGVARGAAPAATVSVRPNRPAAPPVARPAAPPVARAVARPASGAASVAADLGPTPHPGRTTVRRLEPALVNNHDDRERVGRQLLADGLIAEAIVAFRQWSYQCPDDPLAHFQMAVALERAGDPTTARRAFRAALAALDRSHPEQLAHVLQGYDRAELRNLLLERSSGSSVPADKPGLAAMKVPT